MKHFGSILFALLFLGSCAPEKDKYHFYQLEGKWSGTIGEYTYEESWTKKGEGYIGRGVMLLGSDTLMDEHINLSFNNDSAVYAVKLTGESKQGEVGFRLTNFTESSWTFSNPNHDFPQDIVYQLKGKDSLVAYIEGTRDGKTVREYFRLKKD